MKLAFKMSRRRVWLLPLLLLALPVAFLARPVVHLLVTSVNDRSIAEPLAPGMVDDASRLNRTRVAEVWPIPHDVAIAEQELVTLIERARRDKLPIAIAGARHSMGGHTISPGGIVLDMLPFHQMAIDDSSGILHVQAGARWSEIIPYLDERGWSVAVMQSNDSFSVGGSSDRSFADRPAAIMERPCAGKPKKSCNGCWRTSIFRATSF